MHSADVRITHLESPEIQYLLIGYLLMIALSLPLSLCKPIIHKYNFD